MHRAPLEALDVLEEDKARRLHHGLQSSHHVREPLAPVVLRAKLQRAGRPGEGLARRRQSPHVCLPIKRLEAQLLDVTPTHLARPNAEAAGLEVVAVAPVADVIALVGGDGGELVLRATLQACGRRWAGAGAVSSRGQERAPSAAGKRRRESGGSRAAAGSVRVAEGSAGLSRRVVAGLSQGCRRELYAALTALQRESHAPDTREKLYQTETRRSLRCIGQRCHPGVPGSKRHYCCLGQNKIPELTLLFE